MLRLLGEESGAGSWLMEARSTVVFTTRLSARSVAEPHVTHPTPVDIRECPRPSLQLSRGQI